MKRLLRRFAWLALFLALLSGAAPGRAAQGPNADFFLAPLAAWEQGDGDLEYPQSAVAVGDMLYIQTDEALYRWKADWEEPERLLALPFQEEGEAGAPDPLAELREILRSYHATLLTDGQRLLLLDAREGTLWRLTEATGAWAPAPERVLDFSPFQTPEGEYRYPGITDIKLMDGWLYLAAVDYDESETPSLYRWELANPKAGEPLPCQITSLAPYRDGRFLCLLADQEEWSTEKEPTARLAIFTPQTNAFEELFPVGKYDCTGLAYNPENDTAYYLEGATAYSLPGLALPAKKSAYFLQRRWDNFGCSLMGEGLYYQAGSQSVSIRALDMPDIQAGALSLYGMYGSPAHLAFATQHPEIPTALLDEEYASWEALARAMVSGQDAPDVLRLRGDKAPLSQLIGKGYAMDLSGDAQVMAVANAMYPALVEVCRRNGKLYALPVDMRACSLGYNRNALGELGLTQEDLPKSWREMLTFAARWPQDYGQDHPGIRLMRSFNVKEELLDSLLENYAAYSLKTWGRLDFGSPLFERLMREYDAIDGSWFSQDIAGEEELWSEKCLLDLRADYTTPEYWQLRKDWGFTTMPLPLPLEEGLDLVIPATLDVMTVNPRTSRPRQALLCLATASRFYDRNTGNLTLFPAHNEPVPNPRFEEEVSGWKKDLARIEKALETAVPEDRAGLEGERADLEARLENAEDYRYIVTPEAISYYRESIAPCLYPVGQTPLNPWREGQENQLYVLIAQYRDGALPLERFLQEISNRARMMELESR